ncbi:acyl carrier protein [Oscillatoriales cyanobacterium LEGE 11467]|uniref:Acyl carrier protein n=1 Tax=Zarconia navalis LEGE 11467 TaxID=1828826 RepID=A0A928Z5M7_9CYAN|nr:phosphopantetheine-binding protein [Zarconia navalis]MBE9039472.1 acyl carrier protein [Zarconia navalis LEGE 11467]
MQSTNLAKTKSQIRDYLSQFLEGQELDDDRVLSSLGFTSMFSMQLILFLEREFEIEIETEDLEGKSLNTVNSIAEFLEEKKQLNGV